LIHSTNYISIYTNFISFYANTNTGISMETYLKGRGAQINPKNPFSKNSYTTDHIEGLDEEEFITNPERQLFYETPQGIISKYNSQDLGGEGMSLNPYQGCEHGCIYCYARNSHQYWGFSAGIDFETKLIIKRNAPQLLEKALISRSWIPRPVMMSGNTDCYQPIERKEKITRALLKVFAKYRNPVSMITKNSLILRDLDILKDLASDNLISVFISINAVNDELRLKMEPRTATAKKRFATIEALANAGIPAGVMIAPVIPGLNDHEIPQVIEKAAEAGATGCGYEVVRLNGSVGVIFKDWLVKNYPDKALKVWSQIESLHGGKVNDSEWGRRLTGDGKYAMMIARLFQTSKEKFFKNLEMPVLSRTKFRKGGNLTLF